MPFQSRALPTQIWELFLQTPGIRMITGRKTQAEEGRFWHTRAQEEEL